MNKIILYIAISQDGFIADENRGVDWLPHPQDFTDDFGFHSLLERISTIVMGANSYHQILGFGDWAWGDKQTYVFTTKAIESKRPDIIFVHESPKEFVENLRNNHLEGDLWLLGGAELIKSFAKEKLIDECIITIIPIQLEKGIRLELPYEDFDLIAENTFVEGIVQKRYNRII